MERERYNRQPQKEKEQALEMQRRKITSECKVEGNFRTKQGQILMMKMKRRKEGILKGMPELSLCG